MSERTPSQITQPDRPGNGISTRWQRQIGDRFYSFTHVSMPSGEIRLFASVWDGANPADRRWAHEWHRIHAITFPPTA